MPFVPIKTGLVVKVMILSHPMNHVCALNDVVLRYKAFLSEDSTAHEMRRLHIMVGVWDLYFVRV